LEVCDYCVIRMDSSWDIEQETMLYRAICRYKPAGVHKHFRMLSIHNFVNSPHIAGSKLAISEIWQKLGELYDLPGLDDLEDNGASSDSSDSRDSSSELEDFVLPWDEYGDLMIEQAQAQDPETPSDIQPESPKLATPLDSPEEVELDQTEEEYTMDFSPRTKRKTRAQTRYKKRDDELDTTADEPEMEETKEHTAEPEDDSELREENDEPEVKEEPEVSTPPKATTRRRRQTRTPAQPVRRSTRRK
jgi:hypothetical protein